MSKTLKGILLATLMAAPAVYATDVEYNWTSTGTFTGSGTLELNPVGINDATFSSPGGDPSETDFVVDSMTGSLTYGSTTISVGLQAVIGPANNFSASYIGPTSGTVPTSGFDAVFLLTGDGGSNWHINDDYGSLYGSQDKFGSTTFTLDEIPVAPVPESPLNPSLVAAAGLFIGWRSWRTVRAARD